MGGVGGTGVNFVALEVGIGQSSPRGGMTITGIQLDPRGDIVLIVVRIQLESDAELADIVAAGGEPGMRAGAEQRRKQKRRQH